MRTRIIKIGNSQGIRIPKPVLDQARLSEEVELRVQDHEIVIAPIRKPRSDWAEAFREMAQHGDDGLLDVSSPSLTLWDEQEWEW